MAHHQVLGKAQFCQVIEQIALVSCGLVEILMRRLPTACAQQTDSRRAAVGGGGVEVFKLYIEMRPQRVRHQTSRVNVSPGQRTDVNDQQLKRLSIGRQRVREFRLTLIFRSVKTGEPRVQVSGCRRCSLRRNIPNHRRIPCCRDGSGGGTARGGYGCRRLTGWPQREARARQRQYV